MTAPGEARFYSDKPLRLERRHFINSYPPFNVTRGAGTECLDRRQDLLLYVHIPFCPTICTYCFYKRFGSPSQAKVETYLGYLEREIRLFARRPEVQNRRVKTLYLGGGTPTVLDSRQFVRLFGWLREHLDLETVEEICCELMPHEATATRDKLATLADLGVTRISFGVESLSEDVLSLHNRPCTRELYETTYDMVRQVGFPKINIDVMSGLAGETWESWVEVVEQLLAWAPPSVSIYKTEMFYNTPMVRQHRKGRTPPTMIGDDEEIRHIRYAHDTFRERGGYTVANCLHLLKDPSLGDLHYRSLWEGGELKGLGLSAHSSYRGVLHQNAAELPEYYRLIDAGELPIKRAYHLTTRDLISQAMVNGLKNLEVDRGRFVSRFGFDFTMLYGELIERLVAVGAVTLDQERLRVTPDHAIFADDICRQFFLPELENMMPARLDRAALAGSAAGSPTAGSPAAGSPAAGSPVKLAV